ncbi:DsbA family protein [Sphingomonas sp. XMGL2]|uniref:DsbA family protein n=1 Tax=Sphingomonas quercus TaxID=2842451 RepID=A0ABS6BKG3_9SPHN|nr:DsbA family protein [Sphingomonas quercus]
MGATIGAVGAGVLYAAVPQAMPSNRAEMESLVHDYIMAHPEIIPQAMAKAQENAVAQLVRANKSALETPYAGAVGGNPRGDVTLVEFFDYACGYCRASVADVDRLIADDRNLRVVFREFPILSPQSEVAARSSLSAAKAGTFMAFHRAMYAKGKVTAADIAQVEKATGTPHPGQIDADHDKELEKNVMLARALQLSGTPAFIVGDRILNGAVGYDQLKAAIDAERAKKG